MISRRSFAPAVSLILAVPILFLLASCGGGDDGLTRAEVEEIVQNALESAPEPQPGLTAAEVEEIVQNALNAAPEPQPGLTAAEVEEIVQNALDAVPEPQPGLTAAEVEEIVQNALGATPEPQPGLTAAEVEEIARDVVASTPFKSEPAEYTKFIVNKAIYRYEAQGIDATLAYYNREDSIEGQWYVFIIDESGIVIAHPDPGRVGLDLHGWVGTDANGYNFGPEMLSATEDGKWVSYVYQNPERGDITPSDLGEVDLKNAWVVRHDGMLFASGWYIDVDQLTQDIVAGIADLFNSMGLEDTIQYLLSNPESILGGVAESAVAYNASGAVEGEWSAFIADPNGAVALHFNPSRIGMQIDDLLGLDTQTVPFEGVWLTSETMRIWTVNIDGWLFGAGWLNEGPGN